MPDNKVHYTSDQLSAFNGHYSDTYRLLPSQKEKIDELAAAIQEDRSLGRINARVRTRSKNFLRRKGISTSKLFRRRDPNYEQDRCPCLEKQDFKERYWGSDQTSARVITPVLAETSTSSLENLGENPPTMNQRNHQSGTAHPVRSTKRFTSESVENAPIFRPSTSSQSKNSVESQRQSITQSIGAVPKQGSKLPELQSFPSLPKKPAFDFFYPVSSQIPIAFPDYNFTFNYAPPPIGYANDMFCIPALYFDGPSGHISLENSINACSQDVSEMSSLKKVTPAGPTLRDINVVENECDNITASHSSGSSSNTLIINIG